jgi:hypothetical protein
MEWWKTLTLPYKRNPLASHSELRAFSAHAPSGYSLSVCRTAVNAAGVPAVGVFTWLYSAQ